MPAHPATASVYAGAVQRIQDVLDSPGMLGIAPMQIHMLAEPTPGEMMVGALVNEALVAAAPPWPDPRLTFGGLAAQLSPVERRDWLRNAIRLLNESAEMVSALSEKAG